MTIAIYSRSSNHDHSNYIEDIYRLLKDEGVDLIIFEPYYQFIKKTYQFNLSLETFSNSEELIAKASYVISLGGDGTLLETIDLVKKSGVPLLGVNTGRLGFLASVNTNDLKKSIQLLLKEKFTLDKRELIGGQLPIDNVVAGYIYLIENSAVTGQILEIDGGWSTVSGV